MQTFLPDPDFTKSAQILDSKRLGKQRVEAYQLLNSLDKGYSRRGWLNHPARLMWIGYVPSLRNYLRETILEWVRRGYKNTMLIPDNVDAEPPYWLGDAGFHASHRGNLLRKSTYYSRFNWRDRASLPYVWPLPKAGAVDPVTGKQY